MYIQLQLDISFGVPQCNSIGCCSLPLMNGLLYNNDMMLVTTFLVAYFLFNTLSMYSPVKICKSSLHRWWGNHHHVTRKKNTSTASSFRCGKNGSNIWMILLMLQTSGDHHLRLVVHPNIYNGFYIQRVVVSDFWTINVMPPSQMEWVKEPKKRK